MKIKNDKGEEIEVFTSEEVETKTKAAADEASKKAEEQFKSQNETVVKEKKDLEDKLAEAEAKLQAAEEDDDDETDPKKKGQIERLRKERDEAKKKAEDAAKDVDKKFQDFRAEIFGDTKKQYLDALSKDDVELRKKIEYHFDNYRPNDSKPSEIKERMETAFALASGSKPTPGILDGRTGGSDRGDGGGYKPSAEQKELSPNQKAIGQVLNITDKDRENYEKFKKEREGKKAIGLIPPDSN